MGRLLTATVISIGLLFGLPAVAQAATATSVAMYSDAGDFIGAGGQRLFTPANGSVTVSGTTADLSVSVSGGPSGDDYTFQFAAPPGQALAPGVYVDAQRAPFRTAGHPGIDISGDGRGCNEDSGQFEVKDIGADADGKVNRLWIVYEQHCEGGTSALFGEVRIAEPVADAPATPATAVLRWPPVDASSAGTAVPVTLVASAPVTVKSVAVKGDNPGDFPLRLDDCSGKSLAAGATCEVWPRFVPTTAGTRTASLDITDGDGGHHTTALQGFSFGGTTKATMQSDQGDYIGAGKSYSYTPADATLVARGTRQDVTFGITGADGSDWTAEFKPASGDIIAPGAYDNASRAPFSGNGVGLEVSGNGRGCNELSGKFTVTEATFDGSGRLKTFGATFEQHCEHADPAFRGELDYRAGDTTPLAPWMGGPPSTSSPATSGAVTLKPVHTDIAYGVKTRLRGVLTAAGKPAAGKPVTLQASVFPYSGTLPVAQATTDAKGRFSFVVKPDRNTRYTAVAADATSKPRTVFVYLAGKVRRTALGHGRYRVTINLAGPPGVPYAGRRVFFYKLSHKGKRARRVAHAVLRGLGHGRLRARAVLRLGSRKSKLLACMPEPTPDAWGRPAPIDKACGAPRLVSTAQRRVEIAERGI